MSNEDRTTLPPEAEPTNRDIMEALGSLAANLQDLRQDMADARLEDRQRLQELEQGLEELRRDGCLHRRAEHGSAAPVPLNGGGGGE